MGAILLASASASGQSGLGLSVNDQLVVPPGQLESFVYEPGDKRILAKTFFGDIRCTPGDQSGTGNLVFELDKFSSLEAEAVYQVFSTGSVNYDLGNRVVNVTTSEAIPSPDCVHFIPAVGMIDPATGQADPGTFWAGDFEAPFSLEAQVTDSAVVGTTLTIRFTLTNVSKLLVGTNIQAPFRSALTPSTSGITGPVYSTELGSMAGDTWSVPILWPGESAAVDVSYDLSAAEVGDEIRTSIDEVTAFDRNRLDPLATGGLQIAVINTSTTQ